MRLDGAEYLAFTRACGAWGAALVESETSVCAGKISHSPSVVFFASSLWWRAQKCKQDVNVDPIRARHQRILLQWDAAGVFSSQVSFVAEDGRVCTVLFSNKFGSNVSKSSKNFMFCSHWMETFDCVFVRSLKSTSKCSCVTVRPVPRLQWATQRYSRCGFFCWYTTKLENDSEVLGCTKTIVLNAKAHNKIWSGQTHHGWQRSARSALKQISLHIFVNSVEFLGHFAEADQKKKDSMRIHFALERRSRYCAQRGSCAVFGYRTSHKRARDDFTEHAVRTCFTQTFPSWFVIDVPLELIWWGRFWSEKVKPVYSLRLLGWWRQVFWSKWGEKLVLISNCGMFTDESVAFENGSFHFVCVVWNVENPHFFTLTLSRHYLAKGIFCCYFILNSTGLAVPPLIESLVLFTQTQYLIDIFWLSAKTHTLWVIFQLATLLNRWKFFASTKLQRRTLPGLRLFSFN